MMNRRRRPERRFGIPFLLLVGASLVLSFAQIPGAANVPFHVADGADEFPRVAAFQPGGEQRIALEVGDRLRSVEGNDLLGVSETRLRLLLLDLAVGLDRPLEFEVERRGQTIRRLVDLNVGPGYSAILAVPVVYLLAVLILVLRAPSTPTTRWLIYAFAATTLVYGSFYGGPPHLTATSWAMRALGVALHRPLLTIAFLQFPRADRSAGTPRWPWLLSLIGLLELGQHSGILLSTQTAQSLNALAGGAWILLLGAIITRNYRRSGPLGRRQIRWVVFGVYVGSLVFAAAILWKGFAPAEPGFLWTSMIAGAAVAFPITIAIAVLRYDLFDIDRVIGAAAVYNVLGVVLVGGGLLVVPRLAAWLSTTLSLDPAVGQTGLSFALALFVVPGYRRLRPVVERLLFRERLDLHQGMRSLATELSEAQTPGELWQRTGRGLDRLFRSATTALYARTEHSFVPVYAQGRAVPPAIRDEGGLIAELRQAAGAIPVDRAFLARLGAVGEAEVASLDAAALVPILRGDVLEGFIVLSEKVSGDILTATDLSLLSTLSQSLGVHLLRFEEAEVLKKTRALQEALRRYVPGAIADEITAGQELVSGEREVTVLFIDIRGYTSFSEGRAAAEIFSTVNAYTSTVSRIVRAHGGAVVEFNGDGMMVVFGAPRELPEKEACAVRAALELVDAVPRLATSEGAPLMVGVGVATGSAFVGNIRAVDRDIWSAIGNTTNLAARLQSMTRDLDVGIILDDATGCAAGEVAAGFTRHFDVEIRGRREGVDLFAR